MKHTITMFLSSLLLFSCLFYYWQKENEFQKQLDGVEIRIFVESKQDKDETTEAIMNVEGIAGVEDITTNEIVNLIKEDMGEETAIEELNFPYVLSVHPLNRGEEDLRKLALRLKEITGVIDVVYGQGAVKALWRQIRELRLITAVIEAFFFFIFILSLSLYINFLPAMRHSRVFLLHGKSLVLLRMSVVFRAIFLSLVVSTLSVGITYLSYLYISRSSDIIFLPNHWIYYFISVMMFIGLLTGSSKRFPISG